MQTIEISAASFFEMLKMRDVSMWELFAQMVDGSRKLLLFLDADGTVLFDYELPADADQLETDRKKFAEEYTARLAAAN